MPLDVPTIEEALAKNDRTALLEIVRIWRTCCDVFRSRDRSGEEFWEARGGSPESFRDVCAFIAHHREDITSLLGCKPGQVQPLARITGQQKSHADLLNRKQQGRDEAACIPLYKGAKWLRDNVFTEEYRAYLCQHALKLKSWGAKTAFCKREDISMNTLNRALREAQDGLRRKKA